METMVGLLFQAINIQKKNMENLKEPEVGVEMPKAPRRNMRRIKLVVAGWVVAVLVLFVAVFAVGIYRLKWSGPVVEKIEAVLPYPAAMIDWRILSLKEYNDRFTAYKRAITYNQSFDFNDPSNSTVVSQQKQALLDRMIDLKLESALAAKKKLQVSAADIDREMTNLYAQTGNSQDEIKKLLSDVYGWTPEQFISVVLKPQILENKLQKSLVEDREANKDAYVLAQGIKDELAKGSDFAALAKQYSADSTTKDNGGDLGWATKGMLVPEFEQAIFSMQPNQISDIIPSQYGLHIIQVLETGKNDKGEPQVHARHILVSTKDFAQWISDQRSKAVIWKFAPV